MPLIKRKPISEKKLTAVRKNQKLSHHGATAAIRARIRAAHLRHGFNLEAMEVAMRALAEDPRQYRQLVEGLWETYQPSDAAQEELVIRLARATWLMNRADRIQEGNALRKAQGMSHGRQNRLHAEMMRMKMTADSLELLAESVAVDCYVTTPADLERMKNLREDGAVDEMGEIAMALFLELQAPEGVPDAEEEYKKAQRVVQQVKDIFGIGRHGRPPYAPPDQPVAPASPAAPGESAEEGREEVEDEEESKPQPTPAEIASSRQRARYSGITPAEWEARERPRQLLENILNRQVEVCEERRHVLLKESVKGPSPYERAAELSPAYSDSPALRERWKIPTFARRAASPNCC